MEEQKRYNCMGSKKWDSELPFVAYADYAKMREALNLACQDAWPNQPQWPGLYVKRAANVI